MKILLCFALLVASGELAHSRLDENIDACVQRYGRVVETRDKFRPDFPQFVFAKADVEIRIRFLKGKAGQLIISSEKGMAKSLLAEILQGNSQGAQWKVDATAEAPTPLTYSEELSWIRSDGNAKASYVKMRLSGSDILTISSAEFERVFKAPASGF